MNVVRKIIGPSSKYDDSIPYAYIAKVKAINRDDNIINNYFSDTICGLITYLNKNRILPEETELFACYRKKEIPIDKKYCVSEDSKWLERPEICHSLEQHFKHFAEEQYKGHIEHGECSFDDRDREGSGPF